LNILYINPFINSITGSRIHSREFYKEAKKILKKNGEKIYVFPAIIEENNLNLNKKRIKLPSNIKIILQFIITWFKAIGEKKAISRMITNYNCVIIRYKMFDFLARWIIKRNNPKVFVEVNYLQYEELKRYYNVYLFSLLAKKIEIKLWENCDGIITVSNKMKKNIVKEGINLDKIHVVPNGVNPLFFSPDISVKEDYKIVKDKDDIIVCFTGSLKKWHGVDVLIKSMEMCHNYNSSYKLLIVGGNQLDFKNIRNNVGIKNNDFIIYIYNKPHTVIPAYLKQADILVAPYPQIQDFYFSPLKLFEYMSMGKSIIASDIGQISEIIDNEKNGLLTKPGNVNELYLNILKLGENPFLRNELGKQARQTVKDKYTWQINASKIINICRDINL